MESFNKHFWKSAGISLAFIAVGMLLSPLGTLIFLAGILPFTQWKVLGQFVAERYLYIPMIGWTLILSGLLTHPLTFPLFWLVVGLYIYKTNKYIPAFKNIETLYENGIENYPDCISNYVNLAERKLHIGKNYDAYKLLVQGLEMDPDSFLCHANLAAYWLSINQPERGKHHTIMAIQNAENRGMAFNVFKHQLNHISQGLLVQEDAKKHCDKILEEIKAEEKLKEIKEPELCGKP